MADDDYDPYANRPPPVKGISKPTAFFYMIQTILGTGILAMPYCMARLGWFLGLGILVLLYAIMISATHLLFYCKKRVCIRHKIPQLTFSESLQMCMDDSGKCLTCLKYLGLDSSIIIFVLQFGILGIFHIYIAYALNMVHFLGDAPLYPYVLIVLPFLMAINLVKHLKNTIQGLMVIIITTLTAYIIFAYFILTPTTFEEIHPVGNRLDQMPITIGVIVYSIHTPLIMNLEETMYTPQALLGWGGIINIANAIVMVIYGGFGVLGYLVYGDDVHPVFIQNLPKNNSLAQAGMIIYAIAILFSYHLQSKYIIKIIWTNYLKLKLPGVSEFILNVYEILIRIGIPIIGLIVVLVAPFVETLMAFLGIQIVIIGVYYPSIMALATAITEKKGYGTILPFAILLIIISIGMVTIIMYGVVHELFAYFSDENYLKNEFGL